MKKCAFILIGILFITFSSYSQNKFDVGLFMGMSSHGSDANSWAKDGQGLMDNSKIAYGIILTNNITPNFSIGLHFKRTKIEGDDRNLSDKEEWGAQHAARGYSYSTSLNEIGVTLSYFLLNKWSEETGYQNKISPFIFGGFGVSFVNDDSDSRQWTNVPLNKQGSATVDQTNGSEGGFQLPVGAGFRFNLSPNIFLDVLYSARVPLGDYLDGISLAGNPDSNDAYQFCGLNFGFRLGNSKSTEE